MNAVADKLREARKLIERGWCQGEAQIGHQFCILGACGWASGDSDLYFDMREPLQKATGCEALSRWNDAPERTQAEVLAAFDKAIQLAESGK